MKICNTVSFLVEKIRKYFQRHSVNYYERFVQLINSYCASVGYSIQIESTLQESSYDDSDKKIPPRFFTSKFQNLRVVSMDEIAHNVIRRVFFPNSKTEKDSPASVDSFLIDSNGFWYFIEFKNQKIKNTKEKCIEKSYANVYWLLIIFRELEKQGKFSFKQFNPKLENINPLDFIKNYCKFILVIGDGCDDLQINKFREAKKANLSLPDDFRFLIKLESYIFKSAIVYNEEQFDREFVKKFKYS